VGLPIERAEFREDEYVGFAERLRQDLRAFEQLLARDRFGRGAPSLGAELEMSMVSPELRPLPINQKVLADTADPRFTVELNRYNLECNTLPTPLAGAPFSSLGKQLDECLTRLRAIARRHDARIALTGILPTLTQADLESSAMTNLPRFRALSNGIRRLRQKPFHVRIGGEDPLDIHVDDVTYEGANTSLQIHLRVEPDDFARVYNAVQLATAPALAVAVNSPTFLGHRLWDETRIALFQQSVDDRPDARPTSGVPRVCFGLGWIERGALELFEQSVLLHEPLLPVLSDEDPLAVVKAGGVPTLGELRLHHGTVWRWNRAVYDPAEGGHLRIEMRALPAGPTVVDMMANAAFLVGLALQLASDMAASATTAAGNAVPGFPFGAAQANFFRAAQRGVDAELLWPGAGAGAEVTTVRAGELVQRLVPLAARGLAGAGVERGEAERLLEIVQRRAASGVTGARWQRERLGLYRGRGTLSASEAVGRMFGDYLELSERGAPVGGWEVP
jgi:gamma-glutamyl:cysteine ligase YbdK (ATP-grasp superfamily)